MHLSNNKPTVATLTWDPDSELHQIQAETVEELGYSSQLIPYDAPIPPDAGILLVTGPYGSLQPIVNHLLAKPRGERPILAYWFDESLHMLTFRPLRSLANRFFSELHSNNGIEPWFRLGQPGFLRSKGARLGFLGDMLWLYQKGLLDVLAFSGSVYADYFAQQGINSLVVPRGYHPGYGQHLNRNRDIAVAWLGKRRTSRRAKAIDWVLSEVERRGYKTRCFDGIKNDFIFDEERTEILNRTKFMLNINFSGPTDELSLRYVIGAASGAVVITEPNRNRYPFIPGKHLIECGIAEMPDKIDHFMQNPLKWRRMSSSMLKFMESKWLLRDSLKTILESAVEKSYSTAENHDI